MAEEQTEVEVGEEPTPKKSGGGLKTILVVAVVVLLEAGTIGLTMWLSGGPKEVSAVGLEADAQAELDKPVEVLVVKDRFPNGRSGRQLLIDIEIYVLVKNRHKAEVTEDLEAMQAQLKMELSTLIRKAEPQWFEEPTLATLDRQALTILGERFGEDGEGEPIIKDVLITKCNPIRADY